jgi:hypothetical protein
MPPEAIINGLCEVVPAVQPGNVTCQDKRLPGNHFGSFEGGLEVNENELRAAGEGREAV